MKLDKNITPTQFMVKMIRDVFGHEVPEQKIIELIETSPVAD